MDDRWISGRMDDIDDDDRWLKIAGKATFWFTFTIFYLNNIQNLRGELDT